MSNSRTSSSITLPLLTVLLGSMAISGQENKVLSIPKVPLLENPNHETITRIVNQYTQPTKIDLINWKEFPYKPDVEFQLAYTNDYLLLVFQAREQHVLAKKTQTNSRTHHDSCVEFFVSFGNDPNYYNFEFNPIGTVHLAYGSGLKNREFIDPTLIHQYISAQGSLGSKPLEIKAQNTMWSLSVLIKKEVFHYHPNLQFDQLKASGNFYKCGDQTIEPHFLSWNKVSTKSPSFHQPNYFGILKFD
ncbi:MAG: carbohydrate-binding family 9-like protein [Flavobacteriaceae bacterium]|nr:carbohydrate-binding family 9-like protein [Flavobacteriaceae bacterium]